MPSPLRYVSWPSIGGYCGSGIVRYHVPLISFGRFPSIDQVVDVAFGAHGRVETGVVKSVREFRCHSGLAPRSLRCIINLPSRITLHDEPVNVSAPVRRGISAEPGFWRRFTQQSSRNRRPVAGIGPESPVVAARGRAPRTFPRIARVPPPDRSSRFKCLQVLDHPRHPPLRVGRGDRALRQIRVNSSGLDRKHAHAVLFRFRRRVLGRPNLARLRHSIRSQLRRKPLPA